MKQEMSQNRFDAGYTIPNNAYYDQSAWTGFDGKPGSNTYWWGRNEHDKHAGFDNSYAGQGYNRGNIGPCRICSEFGHLQRQCGSVY